MLKKWFERLFGSEPELIYSEPAKADVRLSEPEVVAESNAPDRTMRVPAGGRVREEPISVRVNRVPADLVLRRELEGARLDLEELREAEEFAAAEDVRSERLLAEERAVLELLRRVG